MRLQRACDPTAWRWIWPAVLALLLHAASAAATEIKVLSGVATSDQFGGAVAWAGDVNGDGFSDFLIGAPAAAVTTGRAGAVGLYLGRAEGLPPAPDVILEGELATDRFGFAVCSAGDANGDGYDDFLVGAPERDFAGINTGRVYLYLGGSAISTTPARTWDGSLANERFGAALAGGFDFNDDGKDDFAVGSPDFNGTGILAGRVRIFLGASTTSMISQPSAFVFDGDQANRQLGWSLDRAGDVNNDGYEDFIAGAPDLPTVNIGQAVVFFGQASSSTVPGTLALTGELGGERFGFSVSWAGDVNGDIYDDLVVGSPFFSGAGTGKGAVYLFFGGNPMNTAFDWRAVGAVGGDSLGFAVDGGFDINGDTVPDFAAGAPGANNPASNSGEVRIFYGSVNPNLSGDLVLPPTPPVTSFEANDRFGSAVAFGGSYNGDIHSELLAGAPMGNTTAGSVAGYANFVAHDTTFVPVRVQAFGVRAVGDGVEISWRLVDAIELAGLRVESERGGTTEAVHAGWLPITQESVVDPLPRSGRTLYQLLGLPRAGGTRLLASLVYEHNLTALRLGAPDRNPFRDRVRLSASLPGGTVAVSVWNLEGRRVRRLFESDGPSGSVEIVWDGRDDRGRSVPAGLYFVRAVASGEQATRKIIRLP